MAHEERSGVSWPDYTPIPDYFERLECLCEYMEAHPLEPHFVQMGRDYWMRVEPKDIRAFVRQTRAFLAMNRGVN